MILMYRGKPIEPYETFNWHDSEAFAKGSFGGGISHTIKCGNYLSILEVIYEDNGKIQFSDTL